MRKFWAGVLVVVLLLAAVPMAYAQEAALVEKISRVDARIGAYAQYLADMFEDDYKGKITHVGIVDINKDSRPELFYVLKEGKEWSFHFAIYDGDDVIEMEFDENYMSRSPKAFSLTRYKVKGSSAHQWVLESTGKNSSGRNEKLYNVLTLSDGEVENELRLVRTWKGSGSSIRYRVDDMEATKLVFEAAKKELIEDNTIAPTTTYKNKGIITKVSKPKRLVNLLKTLDTSARKWKALPPVTP